MRQHRTESGEWRSGKASPKLLREDLRKLPSDYVTDEIEDIDRVHELDPDHVVESLVEERSLAEQKTEEQRKTRVSRLLEDVPHDRPIKLTQPRVDWVRLRVLSAVLGTLAEQAAAGRRPDFGVRHLWFPEDNVNHYELRRGNPPSPSDRPKHMKNIDLVIDVLCPPQSITAAAEEIDYDLKYDIRKIVRGAA